MAFPTTQLTYANLDASGDDPSQARVELLTALQRINQILSAYNVASGICPLDGSAQVPAANLANATVADATTTVKGKVELATAAEVAALTDAVRAVTPATLPLASATQRGLVELATTTEAAAGDDTNRAVTAVGWASYVPLPVAIGDGGTGAATASAAADSLSVVKRDHGHGNVGSLCFARYAQPHNGAAIAGGGTVSGSLLAPASLWPDRNNNWVLSISSSGTLSGTWRLLGYVPAEGGYQGTDRASLWQRIS